MPAARLRKLADAPPARARAPRPPTRLAVALPVFGTFAGFSLIYLIAFLLTTSDGAALDDLTSQAATRLGIAVTGIYFLMVLLAVIVVAAKVSQRIAHPAEMIESAALGMLDGLYDGRLARMSDGRVGPQTAVGEGDASWRVQRHRVEEFQASIEDALADGRYDSIRSLTREFAAEILESKSKNKAA